MSASPIAVVGMHRSGTTFLGRVLDRHRGLKTLHEPLNPKYGAASVTQPYLCDLDPDARGDYSKLVAAVAELRFVARTVVPKDSLLKAGVRRLTGGPTGLDLAMLRVRRALSIPTRMVLKDPFASLLASVLLEQGFSVLATVRHPCAVWLSLKRMRWSVSPELFSYVPAFEELGLSPEFPLSKLSDVERFGWLWRLIYSYLYRQGIAENVHFILHEKLCLEPFQELDRLGCFLGLPDSRKARRYLERHMFSSGAAATGRKLHHMRRDSAALATLWYDRIPEEEEQRLVQITRPLVETFYGSWHPV